MRVVAIVQARMTSTRLPGKVLKPFGNHPVLLHVLKRVAATIPHRVVAIPDGDEELLSWLYRQETGFGGLIWRGSEQDVLSRYWGAAVYAGADYVVRVTADCPLIDPDRIRATVAEAVAWRAYCRTPFDLPRGLDVEAFPVRLLAEAHARATHPSDREHVGPWMARQAGIVPVAVPKRMRWTLDTPEDYAWFCRLAQHVNTEPPHPTTEEVLNYIAKTGDVLYEPEA